MGGMILRKACLLPWKPASNLVVRGSERHEEVICEIMTKHVFHFRKTCMYVTMWSSEYENKAGKNKSVNEYSKCSLVLDLRNKNKNKKTWQREGLWYFFLQNVSCSLDENDWEMPILTKKPTHKQFSFSFPSWAWESKTGLKNTLARF